MFDTSKEFIAKIHYPPKAATLRFPTDEETEDYFIAVNKRTAIDDKSASVALFNTLLKASPDVAFDEHEMEHSILNLTYVEFVDIVNEGYEYAVTLQALDSVTIHKLRLPSIKELAEYLMRVKGANKKQERAVARTMYEKLKVDEPIGYAEGTLVPTSHMMAVVSVVLNAHDRLKTIEVPNE